MALQNDWDDLMGDVEWEDSEVDSGYFDSDNEAGNPGSWDQKLLPLFFNPFALFNLLRTCNLDLLFLAHDFK